MKHLFGCWNEVASKLRRASHIALFLDFDGTLAPIEARPEDVSIDAPSRTALMSLARNSCFRIWIISGRRLADLRDRVHVSRIRLLGLYGWETSLESRLPAHTEQTLEAMRDCVSKLLGRAPGIWVEEKEHAFSVHYRGAPEEEAVRAREVLNRIVDTARFRVQPGKKVLEVIPREMGDKGDAALRELARLPAGAVPIYVGDDQPDEAAFIALRGGITVLAGGNHRSRAQYRVSGVSEVRVLLRRLKEELA